MPARYTLCAHCNYVHFASLDSQFNINLLLFASIIKLCNINIFASLRNKFSHYRTCSLRFLSWIWTCLHYRGLFCSWRCLHHRGLSLSGRVCTSEVCAAPGGVHHRGLSCIWTCLHYRGLCCSWRCLIHRDQCLLTVECVRFASKIIWDWRTCSLCFENNFISIYCVRFASKINFSLSNVFASLRK